MGECAPHPPPRCDEMKVPLMTTPADRGHRERELASIQSDLNELDAIERFQAETYGTIAPGVIEGLSVQRRREMFPYGISRHNVAHSVDYAIFVSARRTAISDALDEGIPPQRIMEVLGLTPAEFEAASSPVEQGSTTRDPLDKGPSTVQIRALLDLPPESPAPQEDNS